MKFVLAGLGFFLLIILLIFLIFRDPSAPSSSQPVKPGSSKLADYARTNAVVRYTVDGRIVGNEAHRSIRISVDRDNRTVEVIQGYDNTVIKTARYSNKQEAYDVFLRSLEQAGFNKEKTSTVESEKGVCPLGNRFIYEINEGGETRQRLWSNSCNKTGTFSGQTQLIRTLFEAQIPEYPTFISDVRLD